MGFITSVIWEETLDWLYSQLMGLISDFFQQMNNMGAQIFELSWVKAIILFFTQFGWAMFLIGLVVAVFDTAVGAQTGRADIKGTALNAMKGFSPYPCFPYCRCVSTSFRLRFRDLYSTDWPGCCL